MVAASAAAVFFVGLASSLALVRTTVIERSQLAAAREPAPSQPDAPDAPASEEPTTSTAPGKGPQPGVPGAEELSPATLDVAIRPAPNLLPTGKGMWFHHLEQTGATVDQLVAHARAAGLTHLYVRVGSSKGGFYAQGDLDQLLPAAHAGGLKVVGWDFPYLHDPVADVERAVAQITYRTPDGHGLDAFSADIETGSEGVLLAADRVELYGRTLRERVGHAYPLVGTVPNACLNNSFPYAEVAAHFDAFAPMVYWITRDPAADVACNIAKLGALGRPVLPIGQAYDPAIDNPTLVGLMPGYDHLALFMAEAARQGAAGVSFWAWHTASAEMWQAVTDAPDFSLAPLGPDGAEPVAVAALQRLLNGYGFAVPVDGRYDEATRLALAELQASLGIPPTGVLDSSTIGRLTGPAAG